jgi:hypothetical protein
MAPPKYRDPRLDFFRGLALLIIFVAHVPENWLANYTPGRFGFSDSAEIFIFVSGYAAALAYGKVFRLAGWWLGSARVMQRCGQLYAAHLGLFFALAAICVMGNHFLAGGVDYIGRLNLHYFFNQTPEAMLGLFSLHYVPNYFDILPMYIVALALLPGLMLLARIRPWLAVAASLALYLAVPVFRLELPAEMINNRPWFFNPFAWQFLFYTGFALAAGWLKPPPVQKWLVALCLAFVILAIPLNHAPTYAGIEWIIRLRESLFPYLVKTDFGLLRWLHFLALAYLAVALLKGREHCLLRAPARPVVRAGQQALPVFLLSMAGSYLAGMALDVFGRGLLGTLAINAAGLFALVGAAYLLAWLKNQPWKNNALSGKPVAC